jgi:hypothetical protein
LEVFLFEVSRGSDEWSLQPIHIPDPAPDLQSLVSRPSLAPMPHLCWTPWFLDQSVGGHQSQLERSLYPQVSTRPSLLSFSPTGPSLVSDVLLFSSRSLPFFCFLSILRILFVIVRLYCLAIRIDPVLPLVHQTPSIHPRLIHSGRRHPDTRLPRRDSTCAHIRQASDHPRLFLVTHSTYFIAISSTRYYLAGNNQCHDSPTITRHIAATA